MVVFVDDSAPDKRAIYEALSRFAGNNLVLVWQDPFGRTRFIAPPEQHPFFQVVGYDQLRAQINSHTDQLDFDFEEIAGPPPPAPD